MDCPICLSSRLGRLAPKNSYELARCQGCDHIFATRAPSQAELAELYARYCYEERPLDQVPAFIGFRLDEVVGGFSPYRRTNRLLEIGFGAGAMLRAARKGGWEVHGIEFSSLAVAQARRNGFANAIEGDFLSAPYEDASFDVIIGIEVLEHLPDPFPVIRRARTLLVQGGLFYVTTPNGAGISERLLGSAWSVVAPPEHLHLFSPRSLRSALLGQGFATATLACEGVNPHEIVHHFRRRMMRQGASPAEAGFDRGATGCALNAAMTASPAGLALKSAANWALRHTSLGDTIKGWAVK